MHRAPAALIALLWLSAPLAAAAQQDTAPPRTVTVTGTGQATAAPDIARVTVGATAEAETAAGALDAASSIAATVLATLDQAGVAKGDRRTVGLTLSPVYDRRGPGEAPRIAGYAAANRLQVTVRDIARLGDLLDRLAEAGATDIGGIAFGIDDDAALADAARRAAVADARARATLYAEAAGAALGAVLAIVEGGASAPHRAEIALATAAERSVPIAPGERAVSASVQVTFALE
ncbi:MAG: SIMPL domain-containing protein [Pseudomonadota bacterium]